VSVCTPTKTHHTLVTEAAAHGIHVLCEKPIAATLEEAHRMLTSAQKHDINLMVGFNYRYLPNHLKTKEYLLAGKIGKPILIKGEVSSSGPYRSEIPAHRLQASTQDRIGAFFDFGAHMVDLFLWMMGEPEDVSARFTTYRAGVEVDDCATVIIKFKSGVLGSINTIWAEMPDYNAMKTNRIIEITGEKGKIATDFFGPSLTYYNKEAFMCKIRGMMTLTPGRADPMIPNTALDNTYNREIDAFLHSVVNKQAAPIPGREGVECLKLILAAYESARTQRIVRIDDFAK
jgi:predicted dehydrogenase